MSVFEYGWREAHAIAGDKSLADAQANVPPAGSLGVEKALASGALVTAYAAIAQAHYAAANIRTRPAADHTTKDGE